MNAIVVPQFGETPEDEMVLARWIKQIGDVVRVGDVLCEIETGKAVLSVEAVDAGRLARIEVPEGTIVHTGDVLGYLEA